MIEDLLISETTSRRLPSGSFSELEEECQINDFAMKYTNYMKDNQLNNQLYHYHVKSIAINIPDIV